MIMIPGNMLMTSVMILSTIMAISSSNWLMAWAALELNLLSFIPMIMSTQFHQETEASVKYFLSQALGSALMLSFSIMLWSNMKSSISTSTLIMALMIKLGAAPGHFWFPSVMASISWTNCLILSTWQKIAPLFLITYPALSHFSSKMMWVFAPLNAIIGGLIGLNQTKIRSIMAYSSLTHMGWTLSALIMNMSWLSIIYFTIYSIIVLPMFLIFTETNMNTPNQMNHIFSTPGMKSYTIGLLFMSLGGLPPLTGFIPKWMMIYFLASYNPLILMILIIGSLMNLFFYLNITFNIFLTHQNFQFNPLSSQHSKFLPIMALSSMGLLAVILYALTLFY